MQLGLLHLLYQCDFNFILGNLVQVRNINFYFNSLLDRGFLYNLVMLFLNFFEKLVHMNLLYFMNYIFIVKYCQVWCFNWEVFTVNFIDLVTEILYGKVFLWVIMNLDTTSNFNVEVFLYTLYINLYIWVLHLLTFLTLNICHVFIIVQYMGNVFTSLYVVVKQVCVFLLVW